MKTNMPWLALLVLLMVAPNAAAQTDNAAPLRVGDQAPLFTENALGSGSVSLSQLRGKVVMLNFWATWCEPCRNETPLFVRLKKEFSQQLEIVGAVVFSKNADIGPFLKQYSVNYPTIAGSYELMGRYNKVDAVPTTFVIGKDGTVRAIFIGEQTEQQYRDALKSAF